MWCTHPCSLLLYVFIHLTNYIRQIQTCFYKLLTYAKKMIKKIINNHIYVIHGFDNGFMTLFQVDFIYDSCTKYCFIVNYPSHVRIRTKYSVSYTFRNVRFDLLYSNTNVAKLNISKIIQSNTE